MIFDSIEELEEMVENMNKKASNYEYFFNQAFNYSKVNYGESCGFWTMSVSGEFFKEKAVEYNDKLFYKDHMYDDLYKEFLKFYNRKLQLWIKKDLISFLKERATLWRQWQKNTKSYLNLIDEEYTYGYIYLKFVRNVFDGGIRERKTMARFYEAAENASINITVDSPSIEDDANKCIDYILKDKNTGKEIYLQVKPISFYRGLKNTTRSSMNKIYNAILKHDLPLFIVIQEDNKELTFLVKNKYKNEIEKSSEEKFMKLFGARYEEDTLKRIARESAKILATS